MTRTEIIDLLKNYFSVSELVCQHVYSKWGENSWQFLDTDFLHSLLIIRRDILQTPMYCNYKHLHQRGLRCNLCSLVKDKNTVYLSAHIHGKAGDFTVENLTAEEARQLIIENQDKLPCNIRLEGEVSWLHFDVRDSGEKVNIFYV